MSKETLHGISLVGISHIDGGDNFGRTSGLDESLQLIERGMFAVWNAVHGDAVRRKLGLDSSKDGGGRGRTRLEGAEGNGKKGAIG